MNVCVCCCQTPSYECGAADAAAMCDDDADAFVAWGTRGRTDGWMSQARSRGGPVLAVGVLCICISGLVCVCRVCVCVWP